MVFKAGQLIGGDQSLYSYTYLYYYKTRDLTRFHTFIVHGVRGEGTLEAGSLYGHLYGDPRKTPVSCVSENRLRMIPSCSP